MGLGSAGAAGAVLGAALLTALPQLLGGSADLTGSNNTKTKAMKAYGAPDYAGRYVYYGVREHAMASAMNFTATWISRRRSRATHTDPMPPAASARSNSRTAIRGRT